MSNPNEVQKALSDLALIRKILNEKERNENIDTKLSGITLSANLLIQGVALTMVLFLLGYELVSGSFMTNIMIIEGNTPDLRTYGIGFMGFFLVGLLIPLYFILWRAAKHNGEEMNSYLVRNFKYVKNLGLVSDLLMKFITLSIVMLAGKPEWVSPLLAVFTGDYLIQNRFFTLPTKTSSVIGILCIVVGFYMFFANHISLMIPLAMFAVVTSISLSRLLMRYKQVTNRNSEV